MAPHETREDGRLTRLRAWIKEHRTALILVAIGIFVFYILSGWFCLFPVDVYC